MKLEKHPETEMEYWAAIEALGGFIWSMNHELGDGRISDPSGKIDLEIQQARELSKTLVGEIEEKFGVIPPDKCPQVDPGEAKPLAPSGKTYYWDWYQGMKERCYREEYEGMICSACPFSKGVEYMISMGGRVPCGFSTWLVGRLHAPFLCAMLHLENGLDEEGLLKAIRDKAVEIFTEHRDKLKKAYEASRAGS